MNDKLDVDNDVNKFLEVHFQNICLLSLKKKEKKEKKNEYNHSY